MAHQPVHRAGISRGLGQLRRLLHLPQGIRGGGNRGPSIPKGQPTPQRFPGTIHHYKASNVIDFAWAADPDFIEETIDVDGVTLRLIHQANPDLDSN